MSQRLSNVISCRMDGSAVLQLEGAQLLAQCRKVLAAEEASALEEVRALPTFQLPAEQPATQRMPSTPRRAALVAGSPHKPQFTLSPTEQPATQRTSSTPRQAASVAGSPHKLQFTLPPPRDPDATLPVELSEETRQRRAALQSQRGTAKAQTAGATFSPEAPSEAVAAQAGAAQQQTSLATQQQPAVARKPKLSLCASHFPTPGVRHVDGAEGHQVLCVSTGFQLYPLACCCRMESLLGPASPPQERRQPSAAQPSQPYAVPRPPAPQPPAVAPASAAEAPAGGNTSGAAKRPQPPMPKKKSLFDVMRG
jgi:hypothetical protein